MTKKTEVQEKAKKISPIVKKVGAIIAAVVAVAVIVLNFIGDPESTDVTEVIQDVTEVVTDVTGQPAEDTTPAEVPAPVAE
jgi:multidrug resistance efflux pump